MVYKWIHTIVFVCGWKALAFTKTSVVFCFVASPFTKEKKQTQNNPENFAFFCLHCSFPLLDVKVQINTE